MEHQELEINFIKSDSGDWQALYIDGELACEGNSLSPLMILEAIEEYLPITVSENLVCEDDCADLPLHIDNLDLY